MKLFTTCIAVFSFVIAFGQTEGEAKFNAYLAGNDKVISSFDIVFNETFLKNESKSDLGRNFSILDKNTDKEIFYIEIKDKKFKVVVPQEIKDKQFSDVKNVEKTTETKTIAGYLCTKYLIETSNEFQKCYAFVTEKVKTENHPFAKNLGGMTLEYNQYMPDGSQMLNIAESVSVEQVAKNTFELEGYKLTDIIQLEQEIKKVFEENTMKPGNSFPVQTFETIDSVLITEDSLVGKVTVYNFWFTKCAPCRAEIPELNELVEANQDKPVEFIAITFDAPKKVAAFLKKSPFQFRMVAGQSAFIQQLSVFNFPTTIVVDQNRKVHRIWSGGFSGIKEKLQEDIDTLTEEK